MAGPFNCRTRQKALQSLSPNRHSSKPELYRLGGCAVAERAKLIEDLAGLEKSLQALTVRMQQSTERRRFLLRTEPPPSDPEQRQLLAEMDRVMNRMRALEAKLAILDRGGKPPVG